MKPFDYRNATRGEPVSILYKKAWIHGVSRIKPDRFIAEYETGVLSFCMHEHINGMWDEPIKFDYWHLLPDEAKYIAKDQDGVWYWYTREPSRGGEVWMHGHIYKHVGLREDVFPSCDWRESLIERPS